MRTLVIAGEYPWPVNSGSRLRLLTILAGLARCGPTDLFSAVPEARRDFDPPDGGIGLDRVRHVGYDDRPASGAALAPALLRPAMPVELAVRNRDPVTAALARFATGRYDLVWYFGIRPWTLVGGLEPAPFVLDLVDLEDAKIAARLDVPRAPTTGVRERLVRSVGRVWSRSELARWRRLQVAAGRKASATVVCSELDAQRARASGAPRIEVIPNAYRDPDPPLGRVEVEGPPTVLFQGTLRYPPNADGARFLVDEVGPILRSLVPDVRLRLVGVTTPALASLDAPPAVTLVGRVPDIDAELATADLVVVPLRFGSGTRLKVLEAFAHRIPVVSTALGAEGLGAEDGVHLLVAESAHDLADACARLLSDTELRAAISDQAHELFRRHFRAELAEAAVADLARRVADPRRDAAAGPSG